MDRQAPAWPRDVSRPVRGTCHHTRASPQKRTRKRHQNKPAAVVKVAVPVGLEERVVKGTYLSVLHISPILAAIARGGPEAPIHCTIRKQHRMPAQCYFFPWIRCPSPPTWLALPLSAASLSRSWGASSSTRENHRLSSRTSTTPSPL